MDQRTGAVDVVNATIAFFQDDVPLIRSRDSVEGEWKNRVSHLFIPVNDVLWETYRYVSGTYPQNEALRRQFEDKLTMTTIKETIMDRTIKKIEEWMEAFQPTDAVFLAIDGVMPAMHLQGVRQDTWIHRHVHPRSSERFSPVSFLAGTTFMKKFEEHLKAWITQNLPEGVQVILDGHLHYDEAQQKIFKYVRTKEITRGVWAGWSAAPFFMGLASGKPLFMVGQDQALDLVEMVEAMRARVPDDPRMQSQDIVKDAILCATPFLARPRPPSLKDGSAIQYMLAQVLEKGTLLKGELFDFYKFSSYLGAMPEVDLLRERALAEHLDGQTGIFRNTVKFTNGPNNVATVSKFDAEGFANNWYSTSFNMMAEYHSKFSLTEEDGTQKSPLKIRGMLQKMVVSYSTTLIWTYRYYSTGMKNLSQTWVYQFAQAPLLYDIGGAKFKSQDLLGHINDSRHANPIAAMFLAIPKEMKRVIGQNFLHKLLDGQEFPSLAYINPEKPHYYGPYEFIAIPPADYLFFEKALQWAVNNTISDEGREGFLRAVGDITIGFRSQKAEAFMRGEKRRDVVQEMKDVQAQEAHRDRETRLKKLREYERKGFRHVMKKQEGHAELSWTEYDKERIFLEGHAPEQVVRSIWDEKEYLARLIDQDPGLYKTVRKRVFRKTDNTTADKFAEIRDMGDFIKYAVQARRRQNKSPLCFLAIGGAPGHVPLALLDNADVQPVYGFGVKRDTTISWNRNLLDRTRKDKTAEKMGRTTPFTLLENKNGDVRDPAVMERLVKKLGGQGVNLVVADEGLPPGNYSENFQEIYTFKLLLAEFLLACEILIPGGTLVLKVFDTTTDSVCSLVFAATKLFRQVYFCKPPSSRVINSEKYLVCEGFTTKKTWMDVLREAYTSGFKREELPLLIPRESMQGVFMEHVEAMNAKIMQQQLEGLQRIIRHMKNELKSKGPEVVEPVETEPETPESEEIEKPKKAKESEKKAKKTEKKPKAKETKESEKKAKKTEKKPKEKTKAKESEESEKTKGKETVSEYKTLLALHKLPTSGNKTELKDRWTEYVSKVNTWKGAEMKEELIRQGRPSSGNKTVMAERLLAKA